MAGDNEPRMRVMLFEKVMAVWIQCIINTPPRRLVSPRARAGVDACERVVRDACALQIKGGSPMTVDFA